MMRMHEEFTLTGIFFIFKGFHPRTPQSARHLFPVLEGFRL